MGYGTITAHALMSLEARGTLFVTPGMEVVIITLSIWNLIQLSSNVNIPWIHVTVVVLHGAD